LNVQPGDIFACWGTDWISRGISLETSLLSWLIGPKRLRWSPSHVAIASPRHDHRGCWWIESTHLCQRHCLEARRRVSGVQVHEVQSRIDDYVRRGGRVEQYRLTHIDRLDDTEIWRLEDVLMRHVGQEDRPAAGYDTAGALFSGLRVLPLLPVSRANLESVFCSELIAAVLQRLCRMNRANPARFNPGRLLRKLVRQGTYGFHRQFDARMAA
jgi:hypothetical protein